MIKYLKVKYDKKNRTEESFWYLEVDTDQEKVLREIERMIKDNLIRKAPTKEDNYGCFTDNMNVIIAPQKPRYKETIIFDLNSGNVEEISKEEFEKFWSIPQTKYVELKKKRKKTFRIVFFTIILLVLIIWFLLSR